MINIALYTCSKPNRLGPNFTYLLKVPQLIHKPFQYKVHERLNLLNVLVYICCSTVHFLPLALVLLLTTLACQGICLPEIRNLGSGVDILRPCTAIKVPLLWELQPNVPLLNSQLHPPPWLQYRWQLRCVIIPKQGSLGLSFWRSLLYLMFRNSIMQIALTSSQIQSLYVVSQDKDLFVTIQKEIVYYVMRRVKQAMRKTYGTLRCIMGICTAHLHGIRYVSNKGWKALYNSLTKYLYSPVNGCSKHFCTLLFKIRQNAILK